MAHSYSWIVGSGLWSVARDWSDLTLGQTPSTTVPGIADTASITGPAGAFDVIGGSGIAASLTTAGLVGFNGAISASTATIAGGTSEILAGGLLSTGSLTDSGLLIVNGTAAVVTVANTLTVTGNTLEVVNGGSLQAATAVLSNATISVDPFGAFEVGGAGGAAAGRISVDAGATLSGNGFLAAPVIDNGVLSNGNAQFITLEVSGAISGTGSITIGNATFSSIRVDAAAAAGLSFGFTGTAGSLDLEAPASFASTIAGFGAGDAIGVNAPGITGLTYGVTGANTGTLALLSGLSTLATMHMTGALSAGQFLLLSGTTPQSEQIVYSVNAPAGTTTAPAGAGGISLTWTAGATGGQWATPSNWVKTGGVVSSAAPGLSDTVTINAGSGFEVINGNGNSANATFNGPTALNGVFNTGSLHVNSLSGTTLDLLPGATLAAANALLEGYSVIGGTGAALKVSGSATINAGNTGTLSLYNHGLAQFGTLSLGFAGASGGTLFIDPTSTVEVGTLGGAAAGALSIDAGSTASLNGTLNGNLVVNGLAKVLTSLSQYSPSSVTGTISGTGTIQIGAGGTLGLAGSVTVAGHIVFAGGTAALNVSAMPTISASIGGFAVTDTIVASGTMAGVSFAGGTLSLLEAHGTAFQTLPMVGSFTNQTFLGIPGVGTALPGQVVLANGTLQSGTPAAAGPGTAAVDSYSWIGTGGAWNNAANWNDVTAAHNPALVAPGSNDIVTIPDSVASPGAWQLISGSGSAATLTPLGHVGFSGTFTTGALMATTTSAEIAVLAGATVIAGAISLGTSAVVSGTGAKLAVGSLTFAAGTLNLMLLTGGGQLTANSIASTATGVIVVDSTSTAEVGSAGNAVAGAINIDAGMSLSVPGTLEFLGKLVNNGTITVAANGLFVVGDIAPFTGGVGPSLLGNGVLSSAGTLELLGSIAASQTVALVGNTASLVLTPSAMPTITGFAIGDMLGVGSQIGTNTPITAASWSGGGGTGLLTLTNDGSLVEQLILRGDYSNATFVVTPGTLSSGIALASVGVACFAQGTRIATARGMVAVEDLRIGDRAHSAFGGSAPIQWIGHRKLDCRVHPNPTAVWPIRIRAGAFGPGMPTRELRVSPDHALYLGGVLIPARCLIDDDAVAQVAVETVTYFHVELPQHDVLFAENLPAESYLDTGNRTDFANGGPVVTLNPDFAAGMDAAGIWAARACAAHAAHGPIVEWQRAELRSRSWLTRTDRKSDAA